MNESEFYGAVGRLTREQGWSLDSISTMALAFIATNQTRRSQFIRLLKRVQSEENAVVEQYMNEHHGN